jgi:hypothetical protein
VSFSADLYDERFFKVETKKEETNLKVQSYNFEKFLARYNDNPKENLMIFDILEELPEITEGVWLAGGALRRTLIGQNLDSDIDFFFKGKTHLDHFRAYLRQLGATKKNETQHQETFLLTPEGWEEPIEVQLIKIGYYEDVEALLDSFDFTCTQFAYDGRNLYAGEYSLWDISRKRLAVHKITYAVASMRRLIKYSNQGFTVCAGCMAEFLTEVAEDPSKIREDIKYVD